MKNAEAVRKEALSSLKLKVSRNTIARVLKDAGYAARVMKQKPLLTKKHKQKRLAWAKEHETWTIDEWKNVIWSDETAFMLVNGHGKEYCWSKQGDVLEDNQVTPTKKFCGGKVITQS